MSRIGLQMYTLRDYMKTPDDFKVTLRKTAEIGIKNVQIRLPSFFSTEESASLLRENSLKADSVIRFPRKIIDSLDEAKREADILGTDVLRTDGVPADLASTADGYRRYAEIMNAEAKACKSAGLRYVYHFHDSEWITFGDIRGIDILLNETDPETVYFQPDVFWLTSAGTEPSESLKMFKGRAFYMHVTDFAVRKNKDKPEETPFRFAPVGTGNMNWKGIIKTADEIDIEQFVIEQDMCDGNPFDAVKLSFDNLNKMGIK